VQWWERGGRDGGDEKCGRGRYADLSLGPDADRRMGLNISKVKKKRRDAAGIMRRSRPT